MDGSMDSKVRITGLTYSLCTGCNDRAVNWHRVDVANQ